ncbi:ribonuclease inhibitor [Sphingomonas leidyi]|uniref:Ribonuclease inhibitor n=1 Tax=Sphingomonas leidyi TaxID=68569 RepID=A0A7X5UYL6_9SPHN|nr:barstar family protein [Sphingomonas leidyi]NIJ64611.1 ribonuclease inhibitor [Sphingomonas leidyi]
MRTIHIDCTGVTSPGAFWQRYLDAAAPEQADLFGCNLDAFWDAMEAGGPGWPGGARLVFTHSEALRPLKCRDGMSFLDALRRIATESTATRIEFT